MAISSGASKTCSSSSRLNTSAGVPTRKHFPLWSSTTWSANSAARLSSCVTDNHGVAVFVSELLQALEQFHLRADIKVQRRFIEQEQNGLLRERPRQNDALFFAARDFVHPAIAQMFRADLRQGIVGDDDVFFGGKTQTFSVRVASLQNVFAGARRKEQRAFLVHDGDALGARARVEPRGFETFELDASGKRLQRARDQGTSVDLPLAFGPRMETISRWRATNDVALSVNTGAALHGHGRRNWLARRSNAQGAR